MPVIRSPQQKFPDLNVEIGANLMRALLDAGVPVASSCHGDGVCAKCRVIVKTAANHSAQSLSLPNETEKFLFEKFQLGKDQRISCQVSVLEDVEISTSYW